MLINCTRLLASALLATLPALVFAVEKTGPNVGEKSQGSPDSTPTQILRLADELAVYGIENADPVAIIQAAKMKNTIAVRETSREKTEESQSSEGSENKEKKSSDDVDLSAKALLARAKAMAADNSTLVALIADAGATKSRGRTSGAGAHRDSVKARTTDVYKIQFRGAESAEIGIKGDGDTDLDLFVYDQNGNEICRDTDRSDTMYCKWWPKWTGEFVIKIVNLGHVYNRYVMFTN